MDKNIGKNLIEIGENFYFFGKWGIKSFGAGICLAILICLISLIGFGRVYFFNNPISTIGWIISILLIAGGAILFPFYFFGLHYIGLGQICTNTSATNRSYESLEKSVLRMQPSTPTISEDGQWTCICGRVNAHYISTCTCGKSKHELNFK